MEYLKKVFEEHGFSINNQQAQQFRKYYDLLVEKNKVMNLTAITDFKEVVVKHFLDSVYLAKYKDLSGNISVIDVGTGAGFPGIPLKILYPEMRLVLLDSLNKRIVFLQEVIDVLDLENVEAVHGRAEEIARKKEYREQFDYCVSRAVANLNSLSEICLPFVKENGQFISYKSMKGMEEMKQAERAICLFGGSIKGNIKENIKKNTDERVEKYAQNGKISVDIDRGVDELAEKVCDMPSLIHFVLKEDSAGIEPMERNFICIYKIKKTPRKYPRKPGTPFKDPIL